MIIAIDGPAGSGKTTVAKLLAKKLDISYLDTGATYRALTLEALSKDIDLSDQSNLTKLARNINLEIKEERVYLNAEDISSRIRTPIIDKSISLVVSFPQVREVMVNLQRRMTQDGDYVVEGRDITTVVFPKAKHKFYLDAESNIRVKRRFEELKNKGLDVKFSQTQEDLERRDSADKNRSVGPLRISDDAVYIDTTDLNPQEVVEAIAKSMG